jgi:hypothetical protein
MKAIFGFTQNVRCYDPMTIAIVAMAAGTLYSGYSDNQQGQEQKKMYEEQAQIARNEAETQATQEETARRKLLANQRMAYLANGVSLSGTPLVVGGETWSEYQTEIDALRKSGVAQANLLSQRGTLAANSGRAALISSVLSSAGTVALGASISPAKTTTTAKTTTSSTSMGGYDMGFFDTTY